MLSHYHGEALFVNLSRTDREATPANELEDFDKRLGLPPRGAPTEAELRSVKDWLGR